MGDQDRDHAITWVEAKALIDRHRTQPGVSSATAGAFGGAFKKADVQAVLQQTGCTHLRVYYGRNADGTPALVLMGIDADRKDMTGGTVLDNHYPCPPWCPT